MKRKLPFATMATMGGAIAVAALLAGGAGAAADELSDLRATNELLQQRLDQLGQSQDKPAPAPGVPLSAGSFPRSFLIPGTDTSIRVGGSVSGIVQYGRQ
jgi:hypothetical protein